MNSAAFREHASGLLVPNEISRAREVWTRAEWKALDKVTDFLAAKGLTVYLACEQCKGDDKRIERVRRPDGGITLRCAHLDREVIPQI